MKKIFFLFIVLSFLLSGISFGKVQKGDWLIGSSTSLSIFNSKDKISGGGTEKFSHYGFSSNAIKLLTDNIGIGPAIIYNKYKLPLPGASITIEEKIYGLIGLYYFQPESNINPYLRAMVAQFDFDIAGQSGNGIGYGFAGGLLYFISDNIALNFEYSYSTAKIDYTPKVTYSETYLFGGFALKL